VVWEMLPLIGQLGSGGVVERLLGVDWVLGRCWAWAGAIGTIVVATINRGIRFPRRVFIKLLQK